MGAFSRGLVMVTNMQAPILCECIDIRTGAIHTTGGVKPVFVMQLHNESINEPLIKYFNCKKSTAGNYTVPHNSDLAKLYRSTIGDNPKKRYSEAHKILKHFLGYWFIAKYKQEQQTKGQVYFKVTHITPENPVINNAWTIDGTLKKTTKKTTFTRPEIADNLRIIRGQFADKQRKNSGRFADGETLQPAKILGLEPVFHPTKTLNIQSKTTNTQDHVVDARLMVNDLTDIAKGFYDERLDVLLHSFGFENIEAESLAMQAVITKLGQAAFLPKKESEQTNDDWLKEFDSPPQEKRVWN